MNTLYKYVLLLCLLAVIYIMGCEQRIARPVDTGQPSTLGDTNYVEIMPPWGGFQEPRSIMVGNDQLIYVADYAANEIVMLDAGGTVQKRRSISHPISIAQNSKLDLYVGAEAIAPNGTDTLGAVYRISLVRWDTTYLAGIDSVFDTLRNRWEYTYNYRDTAIFFNSNLDIAHSRVVWEEPSRPGRRYPGIGIIKGNEYLVARTGSDNTSFIDPDTRVLHFTADDVLITPLTELLTRPSGGTFITDIRYLTGLMAYPSSRNFILTQSSDGVAYGAIYMIYVVRSDGEYWVAGYDPSTASGHVDFAKSYQFVRASAATFDKSRSEVFIVDAGRDSVFKFDRTGKLKPESFGKYKTTSQDFPGLNNPSGIAFAGDCTLYVADTGNKVIRRFKISTQTRCSR